MNRLRALHPICQAVIQLRRGDQRAAELGFAPARRHRSAPPSHLLGSIKPNQAKSK